MLATGVAGGACVAAGGGVAPAAAVISMTASATLAVVRRVPAATLVALVVFGFGAGALTASVRGDRGVGLEAEAARVPHCDFEARVLEQIGALGTLVAVDRASCIGQSAIGGGGVAVIDTPAPAGAPFRATGWLLPLGSDAFDEARRRAGAQAELDLDSLSLGRPAGLFLVAAWVRDGLKTSALEISPPAAALIRGLTIGDTEALTPDTLEQFRRAGLSHLLAVSGSNVAIVLAAAALLAQVFTFRSRLLLGAAALGVFLLVVGPDPSVLRAVAMGVVGLVALACGRPAEPLHALAIALAVLIVVRPQVVFSVGLHLSLAATAGIIVWAPILQSKMERLPSFLRLPLAVTLSAQAGVLPLLAGVFGQVSLVAPLSNLAAAPAIAPATVLGLTGGILGTFDDRLGGLFLRAAEPFAAWILLIGRVSAQPEWASVGVAPWLGPVLAAPVLVAAVAALARYVGPILSDDA